MTSKQAGFPSQNLHKFSKLGGRNLRKQTYDIRGFVKVQLLPALQWNYRNYMYTVFIKLSKQSDFKVCNADPANVGQCEAQRSTPFSVFYICRRLHKTKA